MCRLYTKYREITWYKTQDGCPVCCTIIIIIMPNSARMANSHLLRLPPPPHVAHGDLRHFEGLRRQDPLRAALSYYFVFFSLSISLGNIWDPMFWAQLDSIASLIWDCCWMWCLLPAASMPMWCVVGWLSLSLCKFPLPRMLMFHSDDVIKYYLVSFFDFTVRFCH